MKAAATIPVVVVLSLAAGCRQAENATLREIVVHESTEFVSTASELLSFTFDMTVDPEGRLHVLDWQESRITVFGQGGEHLYTFGQPGSGPGELRRAAALWIYGDTVYVADFGNGRVQLWDREGEYLDQLPLPVGARPLGFDRWPSGRHVVVTEGRDSAMARLVDDNGTIVAKLGVPPVPPVVSFDVAEIKRDVADGVMPAGFRNTARPFAGSDNGVWLVLQADARIERYDSLGSQQWTVPLTIPEVDVIRRTFFELASGPSPAIRPILLAVDGFELDGDLWILLGLPDDHPATVIVLSPQGALKYRLTFPGVLGAFQFTVDLERNRIFFSREADASVWVATLPEGL